MIINSYMVSRLMVVSCAAKESKIYVHAIKKCDNREDIYTWSLYPPLPKHNVTLLIFLSYWSLQDHHQVYKLWT